MSKTLEVSISPLDHVEAQQHQGLGEGVVPVRHRLDEEEAEAVEVEDLLRHHETAHEEGELDAHHGEHRQHPRNARSTHGNPCPIQ
jgi:hypothetical protein